jgi:hypothetical protein
MFLRILCIFTIFSFLGSSLLKVREFDLTDKGKVEVEVSQFDSTIENHFSVDHCDDCKDDGCSDSSGGDCCQNFCTCTSLLFSKCRNEISLISKTYYTNIEWHFYTNYRSPLLDPALKPPLFS